MARGSRLGRLTLLAALALATPAAATPDGGVATPAPGTPSAADRYDMALRYFKQGDYRAALTEFEAAHRMTGRFEVLFNVAVTQRRLFRYHDAVRSFGRYLGEGGELVSAERRAEVEAEMAQIRGDSAEIMVIVVGAPARLELDDLPVVVDAGQALLVGSGRHVVRARRGAALAEKSIEVVAGEKQELMLEPRAPAPPQLTVVTRPVGATVIVDGVERGKSPWSGELRPGGHRVRARLGGWRDDSADVTLVLDEKRELVLELGKIKVTPWYGRWYVIGGAVVVAGAIGGGIWLATRPEEYGHVFTVP
ncbi:MAG: PEGA domain-containing protein [Deltaproteobacteria bacterium]|nr:PEGA domain-containing protein [Deltaproteobacteria bacterium]